MRPCLLPSVYRDLFANDVCGSRPNPNAASTRRQSSPWNSSIWGLIVIHCTQCLVVVSVIGALRVRTLSTLLDIADTRISARSTVSERHENPLGIQWPVRAAQGGRSQPCRSEWGRITLLKYVHLIVWAQLGPTKPKLQFNTILYIRTEQLGR